MCSNRCWVLLRYLNDVESRCTATTVTLLADGESLNRLRHENEIQPTLNVVKYQGVGVSAEHVLHQRTNEFSAVYSGLNVYSVYQNLRKSVSNLNKFLKHIVMNFIVCQFGTFS